MAVNGKHTKRKEKCKQLVPIAIGMVCGKLRPWRFCQGFFFKPYEMAMKK